MAFIFAGLDHVQLAAPTGSEETAIHFYETILGMTEIEKPDTLKKNGGVWFQCGKQQLHIGIEEPFFPAKKAHPAFYVNQLNELKNHLANHDVSVQADDRLPGYNRFYVEDPFGNRLEFLEQK
ncbi:VOC family protein [Radiobacillus kanasensis]|uniref:VOC family protein n=1 Tax=Radiobacillus kanasensis TaxID=2844358 RepID=UPI001E5806E6|nr:VOC family protein [Radiobacillus kanasensis]UFU01234.1 VOC family protein [Radiobacillus kanasensis]